MIRITPAQYELICTVFDDEIFGHVGDIDMRMEISGKGLNADLEVRAWEYDGLHGTQHAFHNVTLTTFTEDGIEVENDFDPTDFKNRFS